MICLSLAVCADYKEMRVLIQPGTRISCLQRLLRALTYDLMCALDRYAEFLGDFFQRITVHVAQDDL